MIVRIDPDSPVPVFEQLRAQIERLIRSGQLPPGSKLPPIRHLATDLDLARGTVNKVYDALARDGLVATAGRRGTVVLPVERQRPSADLSEAAESLVLVARQLGLDLAAAQVAVEEAWGRVG